MKAVKALVVMLLSVIVVAGAFAQQVPTQTPTQPEPPVLQIIPPLGYTFQQGQQPQPTRGGRGGGPADPNRTAVIEQLNTVVGLRGGGAWWTNTNLVNRLGITDEQKARIERAYENHRQAIAVATAQLEKEEVTLGRLLEAEPLDKNAVLSQIDRVVQARGEVERTSAAMTLEMREQLTRSQWMQLPQQNQPRGTFTTGRPYTTTETPGRTGGGAAGGQRQGAPRSGGQRQP